MKFKLEMRKIIHEKAQLAITHVPEGDAKTRQALAKAENALMLLAEERKRSSNRVFSFSLSYFNGVLHVNFHARMKYLFDKLNKQNVISG